MVFLGTTFIGGSYTALPTPTSAKDLTYLELHGGKYSNLYGTKEVESEPTLTIPSNWNWNTIMSADFSTNSTVAGNVDWLAENVSVVAVKRRVQGTFEWYTVAIYPIEVEEDFNFIGFDRFNQGNVTYEYAIVPYDIDDNPGVYSILPVESHFDSLFVVGKDQTYYSFNTKGTIDTTRNIPGTYNTPLNSRYPVFFHSGLMNFDSGSVEAGFYDLDEFCQVVEDAGYFYKKGLMDFLTDGKPKVLKHSDGRIWLIQVIPSPTDTSSSDYKNRTISFNWIQTGEHDSNEDMFFANLNTVPELYWDYH